jgi:hypothetical protein
MRDFIVVPEAHPFLMTDREAIRQRIRFLSCGSFDHGEGGAAPCVAAAR